MSEKLITVEEAVQRINAAAYEHERKALALRSIAILLARHPQVFIDYAEQQKRMRELLKQPLKPC